MQTLAEIFNNAFFRIPDYQRGYAWEDSQLEDFWKDLMWLRVGQKHYTGMLTLYPLGRPYPSDYPANAPHTVYHLVDGQQRLTTSYLLISKLVGRSKNAMIAGQPVAIATHVYLAASLNGQQYLTFGYESSEKMEFFRSLLDYSSMPKAGRGSKKHAKNIYEKNLLNASNFLDKKLNGLDPLRLDDVFRCLTSQLVFDIHRVENTFDACAMFESINYRGKKLTKFEVLKNRLMYLTELLRQASPKDRDDVIAQGLRRKIGVFVEECG